MEVAGFGHIFELLTTAATIRITNAAATSLKPSTQSRAHPWSKRMRVNSHTWNYKRARRFHSNGRDTRGERESVARNLSIPMTIHYCHHLVCNTLNVIIPSNYLYYPKFPEARELYREREREWERWNRESERFSYSSSPLSPRCLVPTAITIAQTIRHWCKPFCVILWNILRHRDIVHYNVFTDTCKPPKWL